MNNAAAIVRSVITYALCVPLAIFLGYQLSDPLTQSAFFGVGLLALLLTFPILLRWHHLLLLMSWNLAAVLFFVPGRPNVWLVMTLISLTISVLQRALNKEMRFVNVPQVTWPLVCLTLVILVTAKLTGGIGIRAFGSDVYGGRRYAYLLAAILGYFALSAHRIPPQRAGLYVGVFFLGAITAAIGDLFTLANPSLYFIFWLFPPSKVTGDMVLGTTRLGGISSLAMPGLCYLLARYGFRGTFDVRRPWRLVWFFLFLATGFLGGFRSMIILIAMTLAIQFYLEGLHRTKMFPALILGLILVGAMAVPVASKLPYTFQRALAFLPLQVDPMVRQEAEASSEWRKLMWVAVLPEVPKHLMLGKGYALSIFDFDLWGNVDSGGNAENWGSTISGDYHNGPLSVILTFGIWGALAFLWFTAAALRVLYANYRYCDPNLRTYNAILLAVFASRLMLFLGVFGSLHGDMFFFASLLGVSVSLNGGVCRRASQRVPEPDKTTDLQAVVPRPVFQ